MCDVRENCMVSALVHRRRRTERSVNKEVQFVTVVKMMMIVC